MTDTHEANWHPTLACPRCGFPLQTLTDDELDTPRVCRALASGTSAAPTTPAPTPTTSARR